LNSNALLHEGIESDQARGSLSREAHWRIRRQSPKKIELVWEGDEAFWRSETELGASRKPPENRDPILSSISIKQRFAFILLLQ
jgi:hypothetical protein